MLIFRFTPNADNLNHIDWLASTMKRPCIVYATDKERAIDLVIQETAIATKRDISQPIPLSPWRNSELVTITEVPHIAGDPPPYEGVSWS